MISRYGENLKLSIFGASHAPEIGMTLEGIPALLPVDLDALQGFLNRRAPGQNDWSSPRKEADVPHFESGLTNGFTNGDVLQAVIYNENVRKSDYDALKYVPRPGHADFAAWMKYGLEFDMSGGGPFSGRMTAPLCIAGGLCKQWLAENGIQIDGWILQIGDVHSEGRSPVPNAQMLQRIQQVQEEGDSLGGKIGCQISCVPAGLGDALFGGLESRLAAILYSIPAVKAVSFGAGEAFAAMTGSQANDPFELRNGCVQTTSNNCGGILGGISTGMPITFQVTLKPTPSIAKPQKSVNLQTMEEVSIEIQGRHDPCIVPRAVPVVEAAVAVAIFDMMLGEAV
jgi:chorismate synthase